MTTALESRHRLERERTLIADLGVAVLMGGRSSEREVSLRSGQAILNALRTPDSPLDRRGPARLDAIEIDITGGWILGGERLEATAALARLSRDTVLFLGLHGGEGENGTLQGLLESSGRAYTGSSVGASAVCMNKHATRLVLREAGLCVAPGRLVHPREWRDSRDELLADLRGLSRSGWSVKPNSGGSSVSTFLLDGAAELPGAIEAVFSTGDRALVEARIRGSEATCGVLGNERGDLRALTPVEIVPKGGRFFDYEEKYDENGAEELCPPRTISRESCARFQALGCRAHRATGCDGYSRTDFILPRDSSGRELEPIVLEINTLPGMTARSLMPKAAAAEGMTLRDLCLEILAYAVQRHPGLVETV